MYNWDGKEEECRRLYVEEGRRIDEVMKYWEPHGFTPSKRAFQTQFKRWGFPGKRRLAHKNPVLVARVKELWQNNETQKNMLETLQNEGFEISGLDLARLRKKFGWMLRDYTSSELAKRNGKPKPTKKKVAPGTSVIDQLATAILEGESTSSEDDSEGDNAMEDGAKEDDASEEATAQIPDASLQPLNEEEVLRRQLRLQQLQAESDEKWTQKKRRRRTRGWAGLAADAPGEPPRYPSETTIDEGKAYLGLNNTSYKAMRDQFQAICEEEGVIKKTVAGPEKWNQLLQRLIRENADLGEALQQETIYLQQIDATWRPKVRKILSLDVICQDVTKRMRVAQSRMSMAEAKSILGLNPGQTRDLRNAFLAILRKDCFTAKLELGQERWTELKRQWVQESDLLNRHVAPEELPMGSAMSKGHDAKIRAIEFLARDTMKRLQAELHKDPSKKKQMRPELGPGPSPPAARAQPTNPPNRQSRQAPKRNPSSAQSGTTSTVTGEQDSQIDPSLLLAASGAAFMSPAIAPANRRHQPQLQRPLAGTHVTHGAPSASYNFSAPLEASAFLQSSPAPLPIYFRLHPHSVTPFPSKAVWLGILQSGTLAEVKTLALREHPGTVVLGLEGTVVHRAGGSERTITLAVDDDAELGAFLAHVGGGKATFVVLLALDSESTYG